MPNQALEKFDLRTHVTDPATSKTKAVNTYRLHVLKGVRYFERPVGSGNVWYESGQSAGRIAFKENGEAVVNEKAEHIDYVPPLSGDMKLAAELAAAKAAAAEAQAELAAIKAEREALIAPPAPTSTGSQIKQKKD